MIILKAFFLKIEIIVVADFFFLKCVGKGDKSMRGHN